MGIEKDNYVHGAIYVLSLENVEDWTHAIAQPKPKPPSSGKKRGRSVNPFSEASIKAEFKGYGRWRVSAPVWRLSGSALCFGK
jgi:hypothetical protein